MTTRNIILAGIKLALVMAVTGGGLACVIQSANVRPLDPKNPPTNVQSPVKAHLVDGSTVLYPRGVQLVGNVLVTGGNRYKLGSSLPGPARQISPRSVVGVEAFDPHINVPRSAVRRVAGAAPPAGWAPG